MIQNPLYSPVWKSNKAYQAAASKSVSGGGAARKKAAAALRKIRNEVEAKAANAAQKAERRKLIAVRKAAIARIVADDDVASHVPVRRVRRRLPAGSPTTERSKYESIGDRHCSTQYGIRWQAKRTSPSRGLLCEKPSRRKSHDMYKPLPFAPSAAYRMAFLR
jgi:hypothetical protein